MATKKRSAPQRKRKTRERRGVPTKLPPEAPAARDEGPRLIPLGSAPEPPKLIHWMRLAEKALGAIAPDHSKPPRPKK